MLSRPTPLVGAPLTARDSRGREPLAYAKDAATERLLLSYIVQAAQAPPPAGVADVLAPRGGPRAQPWFDTPASAALAEAAERQRRRAGDKGREGMRGRAVRLAEPLFPPPLDIPPPAPPPHPAASASATPGARRRPRADKPHRGSPARYATDSLSGAAAAEAPRAAGLHSRLLSAFISADTDGSGSVSKRELYEALRAAGLHGVAYDSGLKLFNQADADADGALSFEEFAKLCLKLRPLLDGPAACGQLVAAPAPAPAGAPTGRRGLAPAERQRLRRAFTLFDADKSGSISLGELSAAFRHCGIAVAPGVLKRMFDAADADGSGGIDLTEFEALVERLARPGAAAAAVVRADVNAPGEGSAVAEVFRAFETRVGSGELAAASVPAALKMLGIDVAARAAARHIEAALSARHALGAAAFGALAHGLLRGEHLATEGSSAAYSASMPESEAEADARLYRAFALAPSHDGTTIAAHDAPPVLWRAGAVTDRALLEALVPPPKLADRRLNLDDLRALATRQPLAATQMTPDDQSCSARAPANAIDAAGAAGTCSGPALLLRALELRLEPALGGDEAVRVLCVAVEGQAIGRGAGSDSSEGPTQLSARSQLMPKRPEPMPVELEVVLPSGAAVIKVSAHNASCAREPDRPYRYSHPLSPLRPPQARLLHAPLSGTILAEAALACATLDLSALRASVAHAAVSGAPNRHTPTQYDVPLSDSRASIVATLSISIAPLAPAFGPPPPPVKATPGGLASREALLRRVTDLEDTLRAMRERTHALEEKNRGYAEELRAREPSATLTTGWRAAGVKSLDKTLARLLGTHVPASHGEVAGRLLRKQASFELRAVEQVRESRDSLAALVEDEEARVQAAAIAEFQRIGGFEVPW